MAAHRSFISIPSVSAARPRSAPARAQVPVTSRPGFSAYLATAARQGGAAPMAGVGRELDPTMIALAARQRGTAPTAPPPVAGATPLAFGVPATSAAARPASALRLPGNLGPIVAEAAERYGVDPALIAAVIDVESGFNPNAVSPAGAKGLMQLMDATARGLGVTNSLDPRQNVLGGAKFLGQLLERYRGDARLALAAYNAGPGAVDRYGGVPPFGETQRYVPKVLAAHERYRG